MNGYEPISHSDEWFGELNQLIALLDGLDDRGLVLSLAAFAEDALRKLIQSFLIPSNAATSLVDGFNAPLGTFSSRSKAAYAMGLLTEVQFEDLERLRKIRNHFAHSWQKTSLDSTATRDIVRNLSPYRLHDRFEEDLSKRFKFSITSLLTEIQSASHQNTLHKRRAREIGTHLYPGFSGRTFSEQASNAERELRDLENELASASGDRLKFYIARTQLFFTRLITVFHAKRTLEEETQFKSVFDRLVVLVERHKLNLIDDYAFKNLQEHVRKELAKANNP